MDRNHQHDEELVALSTAMMFVYKQVMGAAIAAQEVRLLNSILHDVAHAVSNVATIYGVTAESGTPIPISGIHMLHAAFERGATVLRTRKGVEYRQLSMRRGDMRSAIAILTRAHARFGQGG